MSRFDFTHPPFTHLSQHERLALEGAADIVFFDNDEVIMAPGDSVDSLYVLIKGVVREMADDEVLAVYHAQDTFDARAMVAGVATQRLVVHEEALAYCLPRSVVMQLTESNPRFGAFFYASVSQKFGALAQNAGTRELQTLLTATVRDACSRLPVFADGQDSVLDAARLMKQRKSKSILVRHMGQLGMFTTTDFRDTILNELPSSTPLHQVCHFNLITTDIDGFLFDALLTMTQRNIRRLVVMDQGEPVGILAQVDILSYFSNHSHLIAHKLERADTLDELQDIAGQITRLVGILSSHGVKAPQLGRLVQALNARLFERTWQLIALPEVVANSCLIVMGSEGRGEQILKTDQDNALIIRDGYDHPTITGACQAFSDALARFGYPPCPGRIMVNNPQWCQHEQGMRDQLYRWLYLPDADSLMNLAIFVDAEAVAGDHALLAQSKHYLHSLLSDDESFYARFARAIEQFDTPLGFFAQLLTREQNGEATLDIKKGGIFPIVHGIRSLALRHNIAANNTFERLQRLAENGHLEREFANDINETLAFLLGLRLSHGLADLEDGRPASNLIRPGKLSTLEKDLLKDALALVKKFKSLLRHQFRLGAVA